MFGQPKLVLMYTGSTSTASDQRSIKSDLFWFHQLPAVFYVDQLRTFLDKAMINDCEKFEAITDWFR